LEGHVLCVIQHARRRFARTFSTPAYERRRIIQSWNYIFSNDIIELLVEIDQHTEDSRSS